MLYSNEAFTAVPLGPSQELAASPTGCGRLGCGTQGYITPLDDVESTLMGLSGLGGELGYWAGLGATAAAIAKKAAADANKLLQQQKAAEKQRAALEKQKAAALAKGKAVPVAVQKKLDLVISKVGTAAQPGGTLTQQASKAVTVAAGAAGVTCDAAGKCKYAAIKAGAPRAAAAAGGAQAQATPQQKKLDAAAKALTKKCGTASPSIKECAAWIAAGSPPNAMPDAKAIQLAIALQKKCAKSPAKETAECQQFVASGYSTASGVTAKGVQAGVKEARKKKKVGGRDVSILPSEEKAVEEFGADFGPTMNEAKKIMQAVSDAKKGTPAQKAKAKQDAYDFMKKVASKYGSKVVPKLKAWARPSKPAKATKKLKGLGGWIMGLLGLDQTVEELDPNAGYVDQAAYTDTGAYTMEATPGMAPSAGMDPMMMMMMQMGQKAELPAACQRNPNKPVCIMAQLSQQSQQQMQMFMMMLMQMMQQMMQLVSSLGGGGVVGGGTYYDPNTGGVIGGGSQCAAGSLPDPMTGECVPMGGSGAISPYGDPYAGGGYGGYGTPGIPYGGSGPGGGIEPIPAGFDAGGADMYGGGDMMPAEVRAPGSVPAGGIYAQQQMQMPQDPNLISANQLPEGLVTGEEAYFESSAQPAEMAVQAYQQQPYQPQMVQAQAAYQPQVQQMPVLGPQPQEIISSSYIPEDMVGGGDVIVSVEETMMPAYIPAQMPDLGPLPGQGMPTFAVMAPEEPGALVTTEGEGTTGEGPATGSVMKQLELPADMQQNAILAESIKGGGEVEGSGGSDFSEGF